MDSLVAARQKIISKLIAARLEKGLTQEQLAKKIGTQRSNISRLESGVQNLSLDMLAKICDALDMSFDFILEERSDSVKDTNHSPPRRREEKALQGEYFLQR